MRTVKWIDGIDIKTETYETREQAHKMRQYLVDQGFYVWLE